MPQQQPSAYPECRHILTSGRKCHSPALTGKPFCFNHARLRNYAGRNQRFTDHVELPTLEDQSSILVALNQVIFALTHARITDKVAARLLYAIQLAQNSINRIQDPAPTELVNDYLDGRYGDIVAPAQPSLEPSLEPGIEPGSEPGIDPGTESASEAAATPSDDDIPLLSDFWLSRSGHGDTCWQPANADYPDRVDEELVPAEGMELQKSGCHPEQARSAGEGSAVVFRASGHTDESSVEPIPASSKPIPPKPGPQKSGPWDHPLLDHLVHQLNSGMSEREIAAQLAIDLQANKFALSS